MCLNMSKDSLINFLKMLFYFGLEGLYAPTISHFRNRIFISRKIDAVSSLSDLSCLAGMLSLTYMHKPPPKQFLSYLNILYPSKEN